MSRLRCIAKRAWEAALTNGFGLCVRLLDDDGEGLDCWLQLKRGVPPPFIRVRFK